MSLVITIQQRLTHLSDTRPEKKPPNATPNRNIISESCFEDVLSHTRFHCKSKRSVSINRSKLLLFYFVRFVLFRTARSLVLIFGVQNKKKTLPRTWSYRRSRRYWTATNRISRSYRGRCLCEAVLRSSLYPANSRSLCRDSNRGCKSVSKRENIIVRRIKFGPLYAAKRRENFSETCSKRF